MFQLHTDFTTDHICHEDVSRGHCCTGPTGLLEVGGKFLSKFLPAGREVGYYHTHCDDFALSRNLEIHLIRFLRPTAMHRSHLEVGGLLLPARGGGIVAPAGKT